MVGENIFFHSVGCHFVHMMVSFTIQKLLSFLRSHLWTVDLRACAKGDLFQKSFPVPMSSRLFPLFLLLGLVYLGFMLRCLINLELSFVQGDKYGSICILLHVSIPFDQHHLLRMLWMYSSIPDSIWFNQLTCLFLCQYYAVAVFITIAL